MLGVCRLSALANLAIQCSLMPVNMEARQAEEEEGQQLLFLCRQSLHQEAEANRLQQDHQTGTDTYIHTYTWACTDRLSHRQRYNHTYKWMGGHALMQTDYVERHPEMHV